ncbi:ABC transporter ATP-binding protein [Microbacterium luticocti]|uniref:ABC transporter ATP-binding protein n=1 Tax=Microbacterium luticocti TaxID=451764 RepID=UPI0006886D26|nr:ATP-binding cassette domain-containing protein [Microbacterium luticocti]
MTGALLQLEEAQVDRGGVSVFDALTITVGPGDIVVLRGRSGSGKSTALSMAMGLHPPARGTVRWQGEDIYRLDDDDRAALRRGCFGIVLQDGGLLHGLTALENVLVPVLRRHATKTDRARAGDMLRRVGLQDVAGHTPDRLSGGEVQRVAVARALFCEPQLLIMDEPTASLDRVAAADVIALLTESASMGRGVFVATHDAAVIAAATVVHDIE